MEDNENISSNNSASNIVAVASKIGIKAAIKPFLPYILIALAIIIGILVIIFIAAAIVLGIFDNNNDNSNFGSGGTCSYNVNGVTTSDIKVRLLNCEGYTPVPGEDLIDFETYITGVVYQETGSVSYEALKTQAVAARSFALYRPKGMNNAFGISLKKENNQWILSLRSCTNDQVFCNPDKGCWSNRKGGQTNNNNKADWVNCTVHSGYDESKAWTRGPLSQDSEVRKAVEDTKGQVFLDSNGNIFNTDYTNTNQIKWNNMAKNGKDYFEILTADYGRGKTLSVANCVEDSTTISSNVSASISEILKWSQEEAWYNLIGKKASGNHPYISKSNMDKRIVTIEVPMRVYKSSKGFDTKKITKKLSVNAALAELWKSFYNDVYNEAPNFVFDPSITGCYSYRLRTSGSSLSSHSYGATCDINWSIKGNEYGGHIYSESEWKNLPNTRSKNMILYKNSPIIQIAHKYTLSWGGEWSGSTTDGMHLSFIGDETREKLKQKYK